MPMDENRLMKEMKNRKIKRDVPAANTFRLIKEAMNQARGQAGQKTPCAMTVLTLNHSSIGVQGL